SIQGGLFCWHDNEVAEAHSLFQGAITLLERIDRLPMSAEDLQQTLRQIPGLSSFAASIVLEAGHSTFEALQALEAGRCVISGLAISIKADVSRLRQKDPELSRQYEEIQTKLEGASDLMNVPGQYRSALVYQQSLLAELAK